MVATPQSRIRREVFQDALICAVTDGQFPSRTCDLGPTVRKVIETIAWQHPEANPELVADAFDAFDGDEDAGGWRVASGAPHC
jgi:hypothetical protein